jgi:hypothetical protein
MIKYGLQFQLSETSVCSEGLVEMWTFDDGEYTDSVLLRYGL